MFKEFLLLDLQQPHDKQLYSLKRQSLTIHPTTLTPLTLSQTQQQQPITLAFQSICYNIQDIVSKILTEIVTLPKSIYPSITATFNYNIPAKDILLFMQRLLQIKMFTSTQINIGHFQIKNNHISDYFLNKEVTHDCDDLDKFQKQINNCLKLDRLWKINEYISYKGLRLEEMRNELLKSSRYGKRTNQFFILDVVGKVKIILMVLPRSREACFTRDEEKEIEELFIINKHSSKQKQQNIYFKTSIAQIINKNLQNSQLNIIVNAFPQVDKPIGEAFKLSIKLGNPHQEEINRILQSYKRDKEAQMDVEVEKMKKKLRGAQDYIKKQQESMQKLIKIYSKTFGKVLINLQYIGKKNIKNVSKYLQWIKNEIKQLQEQIEQMQSQIKQLHKETILNEQRHYFYLNKIKMFKENRLGKVVVKPMSLKCSHKEIKMNDDDIELTEEEILFSYDPLKQLNRYRSMKEDELKNTSGLWNEKRRFMKLVEEARMRLNKSQFNKIQQNYYELISLV